MSMPKGRICAFIHPDGTVYREDDYLHCDLAREILPNAKNPEDALDRAGYMKVGNQIGAWYPIAIESSYHEATEEQSIKRDEILAAWYEEYYKENPDARH